MHTYRVKGFTGGSVVNNLPANAGHPGGIVLIHGLERFPWRRKWQLIPVFLPGKSHGQRSLAGYSPWDCKESDMQRVHSDCKEYTTIKSLNIVACQLCNFRPSANHPCASGFLICNMRMKKPS